MNCPPVRSGRSSSAAATLFDGYTSGTTKDFHDGFMASGDMGYLDDGGRLFVVGRDDEMIVSGGENVYPIEVEKALVGAPGRRGGGGARRRRRAVRAASGRLRGAGDGPRPRRTPSSSTCATTSRITKCRARSRCSTNYPAAHRQDPAQRTARPVDLTGRGAGAIAVSSGRSAAIARRASGSRRTRGPSHRLPRGRRSNVWSSASTEMSI